MFAMSQGALAVSFAVAGTPLKVTADLLKGFGFVAFGTVDRELSGRVHPVLVNGFRRVHLENFCQSIVTPHVPLVGDVTLLVTARTSDATNLLTDIEFISGDVSYENIEINRDASTLTLGPPGAVGAPGTTGSQATTVVVRNLRQVSWAVVAGTLHQEQMVTRVLRGRHECF